ncbi:MAG: hypothetical protein QM660_14965 [Dysgonomonas sp.]
MLFYLEDKIYLYLLNRLLTINITIIGLFKSGNPSFGKSTYDKVGRSIDSSNVMTVNGAIGKTGILLALVTIGAAITWNMFSSLAYQGLVMPLFWVDRRFYNVNYYNLQKGIGTISVSGICCS